MVVGAEIEKFLIHCEVERRLSAKTIEAYRHDLQDLRRWIRRTPVSVATETEALKAYLADMVTTRRLSIATVRRRLSCLRHFFRWRAETTGREDPFLDWKLRVPRPKRLPRALRRGETKSLLDTVEIRRASSENDRLEVALKMLVATGLRVGELCGVTAADVAADGGSVHVRGKGARDRVVYVVDPALRPALAKLGRAAWKRGGAAGALFLNRRGRALRPASVRAGLRDSAEKSGIGRRVTPHMLRHTAATLLMEQGVDIRFVQRLLGHASIATTEIYTHVVDESLRAALEKAAVLRSFDAA